MSYKVLMQQAQALIDHANALRQAEKDAVILDIRKAMADHGISVADLGGLRHKSTKKLLAHPAKYRGPQGQLWAGVKGPRPNWVKEALARGESLDAYRLPDDNSTTA